MADPQAMTTAGLQAKVSLRRAWFEAHPNQPMPEARAEVERLFAAIEADALRAALAGRDTPATTALRAWVTSLLDKGADVNRLVWVTKAEVQAVLDNDAATTAPLDVERLANILFRFDIGCEAHGSRTRHQTSDHREDAAAIAAEYERSAG